MPTTPHGKAIASRNATTHGLFARDIVLPSLGEDPEGYRQMADEFTAQLKPRNLLEQHYVEKIAAASWRLRRLHRWQAQLFEDETLTEDERLDRLDKVLRHETALHRQIDTAVKMLSKDVPQLYGQRAREQALADTQRTEWECRRDIEADLEVTIEQREYLKQTRADCAVDKARLDTQGQNSGEKCENELTEVLSQEGTTEAAALAGSDCSSPFPSREGSLRATSLAALAPGLGSSPFGSWGRGRSGTGLILRLP